MYVSTIRSVVGVSGNTAAIGKGVLCRAQPTKGSDTHYMPNVGWKKECGATKGHKCYTIARYRGYTVHT